MIVSITILKTTKIFLTNIHHTFINKIFYPQITCLRPAAAGQAGTNVHELFFIVRHEPDLLIF